MLRQHFGHGQAGWFTKSDESGTPGPTLTGTVTVGTPVAAPRLPAARPGGLAGTRTQVLRVRPARKAADAVAAAPGPRPRLGVPESTRLNRLGPGPLPDPVMIRVTAR